jgi:hypothetical protein
MRYLPMLFATAGMIAIASLAEAQATTQAAATAKPNFAGNWRLVPDSAAATGVAALIGSGAGLGAEAVIEQNEKTITVRRPTQAGNLASVYNLDGSVSQTTLQIPNYGSIPLTSRGRWEGAKFMTNMTAQYEGMSFELTMNLSLNSAGQLIVDMTTPPMGNAPTAFTMKYQKY